MRGYAGVIAERKLRGQIPPTRDAHRRARREHTKQYRNNKTFLDGLELVMYSIRCVRQRDRTTTENEGMLP